MSSFLIGHMEVRYFLSIMYSCQTKMHADTVWHKILTGENIDKFDEFPAIRQYFPYQNFPFS